MVTLNNVDPQEVQKFDNIADEWWDLKGKFKPLHDINPIRLAFIQTHVNSFADKTTLDVGCGGGILTEALAKEGAHVTGLDMSHEAIQVANQHAENRNLSIHYIESSIEDHASTAKDRFDIITCLELLEHVPDPASVIKNCAKLLKPDGHLFFSTLNRNLKSYLLAVVGAEYIMQMLPKGTHDYKKFIRPSELDEWARNANLKLSAINGITYNPFSGSYALSDNVDVSYLVYYKRKKNEKN